MDLVILVKIAGSFVGSVLATMKRLTATAPREKKRPRKWDPTGYSPAWEKLGTSEPAIGFSALPGR